MPPKSKSAKPKARSLNTAAAASNTVLPRSPYSYENEDESDYSWDTWETMLEWQDIWLKAIALAWTDARFKARLLENARAALVEYFNYKLPQMLDFRVVDLLSPKLPVKLEYPVGWGTDENAVSSLDMVGWYFTTPPIQKIQTREQYLARLNRDPSARTEWILPRSLLVYPLPPPPQDVAIEAVALADFSSAGRTYPFTTC
ncbi:BMA_0021/BMA_0022 family TOMM bacteriocin [Myxococcaceae bacterium JPH2]|nr:BMA_0021/BMA_0022 family TOMM bacteriocin [Myxococcaceae bacterium JPH2]